MALTNADPTLSKWAFPREEDDHVRPRQISRRRQKRIHPGYLALPDDVRSVLLDETDFRDILRAFEVRLIAFDPQQERILGWIELTNTEP